MNALEAIGHILHSPGFGRVLGLMISSAMIIGAIIDGGPHEARRRILAVLAALGVFFWFEEWAQQIIRAHLLGTGQPSVDITSYFLAAAMGLTFVLSMAGGMVITILVNRNAKRDRADLDAWMREYLETTS